MTAKTQSSFMVPILGEGIQTDFKTEHHYWCSMGIWHNGRKNQIWDIPQNRGIEGFSRETKILKDFGQACAHAKDWIEFCWLHTKFP